MARYARIKLLGVEEIDKQLKALVEASRSSTLRKGLNKAGSLLVKKTKSNISGRGGRSGALKKSIGKKVKIKKEKSKAYCAIYPRNGFVVPDAYREGYKHDPVKIAHLVEYGHGGPAPAPPHPFMRPAMDTSGRAATNLFKDVLKSDMEKIKR